MRLSHLSVAAAALAVATPPGRAQQPERPERTEEVRAVGLVRTLHTGDVDSVVGFLQENLAPAMWSRRSADEWRGMAGTLIRDLGGAELGGGPGVSAVLESDGSLVVAILSNYDPPTAEAIARQLSGPLRQALR